MSKQPENDHDLPLTDCETQIIALIDQGLSNEEIASELNLELGKVKHHVHSILSKYRVTRRSQAAAQYRLSIRDKSV